MNTPTALAMALALLLSPVASMAEYKQICSIAADTLTGAANQYELAKRNFEWACDPDIGDSYGDESACGENGTERLAYSMAKDWLESSLDQVSIGCGICDGVSEADASEPHNDNWELKSEITSLEKQLAELEASNKKLRRIIELGQ
jgi:hypothetical protein